MGKAGSECTRHCAQTGQAKSTSADRQADSAHEAAAHFAFSLILHVRQHIKHVEQGSASESVEMDARENHVRKAGTEEERHELGNEALFKRTKQKGETD